MIRKQFTWALAALALLPLTTQAQTRPPQTHPATQPEAIGTWSNPLGTVKVKTGDCAGNLCGWVVWAAPQAIADARDSGVTRLVGTELLKNYRSTGPGQYQGRVYVPDMGRTFFSTIKQNDVNSMRISGCILGGLICKSQEWHRA
ncbi:hypothetical protein NT2_09_01110 [Caenibius tardaugens NBRC 16725]|uniref:DUF2147 domain-containing protein n=1 Tax=Caenibius tardaugens NBRC 16725 TaxID=1219035 RepID=U3A6Y3_9SPHN|nr:DUF2147 domain-containing protein [Caenibius tardaugens]AZI35405.1 DUF2147 domain-containing protein [Caenibius tardaugens NBRC 16725]GAD50503.1 hypothetical protein NT2_09_01110 [Caenibius tardaugens NBRC 16725]